MTFKKAASIPAEPRKRHEGELIGKEGTNLIFKEKDGAHAYLPASGKVAEYLKDIAIGDILTMEEEEGVITWVINWVKKGKRGPLQQVQKTIPVGMPKPKPTEEEIAAAKKKGDEIAATMTPPAVPLAPSGSVPSGPIMHHTPGTERDMKIGWYSNLNTACEVVRFYTENRRGKGVKQLSMDEVSKLVLETAKKIHDYVEEQIKG